MNFLVSIMLLSFLVSCGSDSDSKSKDTTNESTFDLTFSNGGTVLGEGLNYSSDNNYLDSIDPGFARVNHLKNKIAFVD